MEIKAVVSVDGKENAAGIQVVLEQLPGPVSRYRVRFINRTKKIVRLDHIRFSGFDFPGKGEDLRLYREGWTAVSAISTVRYGDCDLQPPFFAVHGFCGMVRCWLRRCHSEGGACADCGNPFSGIA